MTVLSIEGEIPAQPGTLLPAVVVNTTITILIRILSAVIAAVDHIRKEMMMKRQWNRRVRMTTQ